MSPLTQQNLAIAAEALLIGTLIFGLVRWWEERGDRAWRSLLNWMKTGKWGSL